MKKIKLLILVCSMIFYSLTIYSQTKDPISSNLEIAVYNQTGQDLTIQMYPISVVFNGQYQYSLISSHRCRQTNSGGWSYDYINGAAYNSYTNTTYTKFMLGSGTSMGGWNDDEQSNSSAFGNFGFGKYKLVIENISTGRIDSALIDIDYYVNNKLGDVYFYVNNDNNIPQGEYRFYYHFSSLVTPPNDFVEITYDQNDPDSYTVKFWRPNGKDSRNSRDKIPAPPEGFEYNTNYTYSDYFPLDPRTDCDIIDNQLSPPITVNQNQHYPQEQYTIDDPIEERHGNITLPVSIKRNVNTPTSFLFAWPSPYVYNPNHIVPTIRIKDGAYMKICSSTNGPRTFTMNTYTGYNRGGQIEVDPNSSLIIENAVSNDYNNRVELIMNPYCRTTVKQDGWLMHGDQSIIYVNNYSGLYLNNGSHYCSGIHKNSSIWVYPNGLFCNEGAIIGGKLNVRYLGGNHFLDCNTITPDIYINDSTQYTLSDGATLIIPDNKIVYFQGPETVLQMDSNSTVQFGQNSRLVFQNGARISAKYSKFTSLTANATYSGIMLSGISRDTIQNCIIENAVDGISIKDKQNIIGTAATTEISNCSFVNSTTSSQLSNAVYILNSGDVLLKNNTVSSTTQTNGFSIGFWFEYCSPVNVNVLNNTVNNCLDGIYMVQSSPFVYGNAITGQTGGVCGLYLDNCNGMIKNNTVTNFYSSLIGNFSTPYLYGNTFSGASVSNLDLRKSTVPVMSPVVSGSSIYWYGGRNLLSGSPSSSYIKIIDNAYPSMDGGYNTITGSSYYIQGDLPSWLPSNNLYATNNYWDNHNFDGSRFDVSNSGTVTYEPLFNGSNYPSYDTYTLISHGFDVYDTVFIQGTGDSPVSSLFTQAVDREYQLRYTDAIGLYKQVISEFKESEYAVMSVSRIFDCLQKMGGDVSSYTINNTYLTGIKNGNEYSTLIRELAEDFIIKGKARAGEINSAISDYETIYQQNQNNFKGLHALINKSCLESFLQDTPGDFKGMSSFNLSNHKNAVLNALRLRTREQLSGTVSNIVPSKYSLEQNYPNPFNPVTKIAYSIPKESRVTLVVYDILGREIAKLVNNETKKAGTYTVEFNAFNFASGIYFYRIQANDFVQTKRMVLVK